MCSSFSFLPSFLTVYSFVYPLLFTFSRNVLVSTIMRQWYILDTYVCGRPQSGVVSPIGTYQDNATSHTLVQSVYSCTQTLIYYSFKFAFEVTRRWLCAGTNHKSDISSYKHCSFTLSHGARKFRNSNDCRVTKPKHPRVLSKITSINLGGPSDPLCTNVCIFAWDVFCLVCGS